MLAVTTAAPFPGRETPNRLAVRIQAATDELGHTGAIRITPFGEYALPKLATIRGYGPRLAPCQPHSRGAGATATVATAGRPARLAPARDH
jgi:hypothetical protein